MPGKAAAASTARWPAAAHDLKGPVTPSVAHSRARSNRQSNPAWVRPCRNGKHGPIPKPFFLGPFPLPSPQALFPLPSPLPYPRALFPWPDSEASNRHHVELFVMQVRVGPDRDPPAEHLLQLAQHGALLFLQRPRDVRVHPEKNPLPVELRANLLQLGEYLEADRRARLDRA